MDKAVELRRRGATTRSAPFLSRQVHVFANATIEQDGHRSPLSQPVNRRTVRSRMAMAGYLAVRFLPEPYDTQLPQMEQRRGASTAGFLTRT
jgi:hypothetical protein